MKKNHPKTPSQILFEGKELLNERPDYMSYPDYKMIRTHQTALIKLLHAKTPNSKIQQAMGLRKGYNLHLRVRPK